MKEHQMTDHSMGPDGSESKIPVVFERDGRVYANSRDVATFFEKQHSHVMQELRRLAQEVGARNPATPMFVETTFSTPDGQTFPAFEMSRDGFTLLAMGFTGPKALAFKLRYIDQFNAMESALKNPLAGFAIPTTMAEALRLAADQSERLANQARKIEAMAPKVEGFDRISGADGGMCMMDAAKALQVQPKKTLIPWMEQHRWVYSRPGKRGHLAYQDKIQAGYLAHKVRTVDDTKNGGEKVVESVLVTPAGLAKLAMVVPGAQRSDLAAE